MIFDVAARSFAGKQVLIPVEELLGDCTGSRMPEVDPTHLNFDSAVRAIDSCPTSALRFETHNNSRHFVLDYGDCTGCGKCIEASGGALRVATRLTQCGIGRAALVRRWNLDTGEELTQGTEAPERAAQQIRKLLGRALNIRQVDAGSCNGCEAEITALTNPYYDLERFSIHFVASPKHADMLLVTGPVTRNMEEALRRTYEAMPSPRLVVAVGACGCSGGIFAGSYAVTGAVDQVIPVNGYIPGCPPTPAMLLTGILHVLGREHARS
ncbi:MAG TPA: NADH-quinone oxidoreductase subunit NuoB [Terracidiphilus sp.]|nr:NADH-quinone oxidoreductase subunit NuoB [Terracidiphilus sp.]